MWWAPIAMVVGNAMQQRQQEEQMREQARAQMLQQSAASLGAPTYNVQGAAVNRDIANMPSPMMPLLQKYAASKLNQSQMASVPQAQPAASAPSEAGDTNSLLDDVLGPPEDEEYYRRSLLGGGG